MRVAQVAGAALVAVLTFSASARADEDPEKLFEQATVLIKEGKYADALPKLEEAQRRDPAIGTQFNIAVCHEGLGRVGSAYRTFLAVQKLAHATGKTAREQAASEKLAALEKSVPRIFIRPADVDRDVVTVRVDGASVAPDELGSYAIDPGAHRIEASAPARVTWSSNVTAPAPGTIANVVVPPLETAKGETKVVTVTTETSNGRRTLAYVLGGIGLVGLVTGGVTGALLLDAHSTAEEHCKPRCIDATGRVDQEGVDAVNLGRTLVPINVIAWGVGIAGLAAGTYLFLTSGKSTEQPRTAVLPLVFRDGAALGVSRRF